MSGRRSSSATGGPDRSSATSADPRVPINGIELATVGNGNGKNTGSNVVWPVPSATDGAAVEDGVRKRRSGTSDNSDDGRGLLGHVAGIQNKIGGFVTDNSTLIRHWLLTMLIAAFHVYLTIAILHDSTRAMVVVIPTALVWLFVIYSRVLVPLRDRTFQKQSDSIYDAFGFIFRSLPARIVLSLAVIAAIGIFLAWDTTGSRRRLTGLGGMAFYIIFMFIFSNNPSRVRWRPVILGFLFQFIIGLLVLRWQTGAFAFQKFANVTLEFLNFSKNGTDFVYGFLSSPPNICGLEPIFAFQPIQVVIYFGSVVALLYYLGVMQWVLRRMAWLVQVTLGTTATESLNACACIFLGQSEAPLLIRPYLERMTASELHAVMTTGFSCIAGAVFATYISLGACPDYLLSATLMSAPGSLACAKLLYPETEDSKLVSVEDLELPEQKESSALECISNGAVMAAELVIAIVANLIVFLAILALLDSCIGYFGELVGQSGWSFELLLGFIFFPLAYIMGVTENSDETFRVAQLMGTKTALNEFIAYRKLGQLVRNHQLSARSAMIATYALCGFSNFCSIGIQLGILGGMAPSRKQLLSKLVLRALLAGSISCFMTASLAGVLVDRAEICMPHASEHCFDLQAMFDFIKAANTTSAT